MSGDADLVQDVSDLLLLCSEHADALRKAPRGEADAEVRLRELSPALARMLADKTLSSEAQRARKLRDAAYTLVIHAERRLRAAAEYWYAGTDNMKDYAPFPISRGAASAGEEAAGEADAEDGAPEGDLSQEGAAEDGAPDDGAPDEDEADSADERSSLHAAAGAPSSSRGSLPATRSLWLRSNLRGRSVRSRMLRECCAAPRPPARGLAMSRPAPRSPDPHENPARVVQNRRP